MFSGIIEHRGRVVANRAVTGGRRLTVDAGVVGEDAQLGDSIAVNGVCLTVAAAQGGHLVFDVIAETERRTGMAHLAVGTEVNLERALRVGDRISGHFVQGHIDGRAKLTRRIDSPQECVLWFASDNNDLRPCLIPKGSVAVDGVSLTIAALDGNAFSVALIPTTLAVTTLGRLKVGDQVNIETDMMARAAVHALAAMANSKGVTRSMLAEHGFL